MAQNKNDDYIFRFKLNSDVSVENDKDPLIETIRSFLAEFLQMGFFTHNGKRVQVDGFSFLNEKENILAIFTEKSDTDNT